jgi:hypothetical protein
MTPEELDHRINVSRRTVVAWRARLVTLEPEGSLKMARGEVDLLDDFAIVCPDRADEVAVLIDLWADLAERLRARAH